MGDRVRSVRGLSHSVNADASALAASPSLANFHCTKSVGSHALYDAREYTLIPSYKSSDIPDRFRSISSGIQPRNFKTMAISFACTNWAEEFFSRMRRAEIGHHHTVLPLGDGK